jgi:large subunit ribosomal protein L22
MEAVAKLNNCPSSPRKMRLVVDNIRGKDVNDALNILAFTNKEVAGKLEKLLKSAINNFMQKHGVSADDADLYISEARVDGGTMLKRFRPAPQGRAMRIRKRSNHVTLVVSSRTLVDADNEETTTEE